VPTTIIYAYQCNHDFIDLRFSPNSFALSLFVSNEDKILTVVPSTAEILPSVLAHIHNLLKLHSTHRYRYHLQICKSPVLFPSLSVKLFSPSLLFSQFRRPHCQLPNLSLTLAPLRVSLPTSMVHILDSDLTVCYHTSFTAECSTADIIFPARHAKSFQILVYASISEVGEHISGVFGYYNQF
jgi:hypothetical protein